MNSTRKYKILIVDDRNFAIKRIGNILDNDDYEISCATTAHMALKKLKNYTFDLALLDIELPDMDGLELCKKIREDHELKDVRIIFISSHGDESDNRDQAIKVGGNDFVDKVDEQYKLLYSVKTQLELKQLNDRLKKLEKR